MLSTDLNVLTAQQQRHAHNAKALLDLAERENRALTPEETAQHDTEVKSLEKVGDQMKRVRSENTFHETIAQLAGGGSPDSGQRIVLARGREVKSLGQQFVESEAGKWLLETKGTRPQRWTSPSVELKAVLSEGPIVLSEQQPGVHGPIPAVTVAQLFAPGTTDGNSVGYMRETGFTNSAAPVGEGLVKPESALTLEQVVSILRKIAHWLPVTDEFLEDSAALRSYIDARLRQGVAVKLDDQVLNGDGVAPNLLGILNTPGLAPPVAQGTNSAADAIAAQIAAIQTSTGLAPTGIVVNPTDWLYLQTAKTTTGEYLGAGPFQVPTVPTLWGIPVAQTSKIALGTALVGAFSTAGQLFTKGGIRVESTNAHESFFIKNLVAVLAEIRAALAVYVPSAFGKVTGLLPPAPPA